MPLDKFWEFTDSKKCVIKEHEVQGFAATDELLLVIRYTPEEKQRAMKFLNTRFDPKVKEEFVNIAKNISTDEDFRKIFTDFFIGSKPIPKYELQKMYLMAWIGKIQDRRS